MRFGDLQTDIYMPTLFPSSHFPSPSGTSPGFKHIINHNNNNNSIFPASPPAASGLPDV
jgi:hypothetical protein